MAESIKTINDEIKKLMRSVKRRNTTLKNKGMDIDIEPPELKLGKTLGEAKEIRFQAESYLRRTSPNEGIRKVSTKARERRKKKFSTETKVSEVLKKINNRLSGYEKKDLHFTKDYDKLINLGERFGLLGLENRLDIDTSNFSNEQRKKLLKEAEKIYKETNGINEAEKLRQSRAIMFNSVLKDDYDHKTPLKEWEMDLIFARLRQNRLKGETQQLDSDEVVANSLQELSNLKENFSKEEIIEQIKDIREGQDNLKNLKDAARQEGNLGMRARMRNRNGASR